MAEAANVPKSTEPVSFESFVEKEIKSWTDRGIEWKYPQNTNNDADDNKDNTSKYTSDIIDGFITHVYKTTTTKQKTCSFVQLLLLFTHQTVIGRIFASYLQIPEYLRNIHVKNKQFTTIALLCWQWNEKDGKAVIPVDFRRVYLIFVTNYLNRIWQYYHIDLSKETLESDSDEYIHIESIQNSLNQIIDSTQESTKNKTKLAKSIVFEKIAENCCSLTGTMIDALRFKYKPVVIHNLQEFYVVLSLIALQINHLFVSIEEAWLNNTENYTKPRFKDKKGDENFVTLVLSRDESTKDQNEKGITPKDVTQSQ
eukprot:74783_1